MLRAERPRSRAAGRLGVAAAVLALAGLSGALVRDSARAADDTWVAFDVVATADGARITSFVPGGPLNDRVFDVGAPKAQARIDGLGTSTAYAAGVYPDELVLNVPGIASNALKTDLPPYPLIASSSHPAKPSGSVDIGGVALETSSAADASSAAATVGATGTLTTGSATAASVVRDPDGSLVATSSSVVDGVAVGPLTIGRITSTASTSRRPDGTSARHSTAVVTGAAVAGQAVTIDHRGLVAAEPARAALAAAGLSVRWLAAVEVAAGVTAAGLEVTQVVPASLAGSGSSSVTTTFGRAAAFATGTAARPGPVLGAVDPGLAPGSCCPTNPETATFDPAPPRALDASATGGAQAGVDPPPASDAMAVSAAPVVRVVPETWPVEWYVVLIGGAGLLALAALALHILGVRSTWNS